MRYKKAKLENQETENLNITINTEENHSTVRV